MNKNKIKIRFKVKCLNYSKAHGIMELNKDVLNNSMKIPSSGIKVEFKARYYTMLPFLRENDSLEKLGHYNTRNGVTTFVYRDGSTYVTKIDASKIISILEQSGYIRDKLLEVPFSRNELIVHPQYENEWNMLHS